MAQQLSETDSTKLSVKKLNFQDSNHINQNSPMSTERKKLKKAFVDLKSDPPDTIKRSAQPLKNCNLDYDNN